MTAPCVLCEDIALHNRFCQEHKTKTPRAPVVANLLGVTAEDIIRHRRHEGCYVIKYPLITAEKTRLENVSKPSADPLDSLQELQKTLQHLLTTIIHGKNIAAGDVVRVTSELRALILSSEDLAIKLAAAKGSEHSAFTQPEIQEILLALKDLCPECRGKVCEKISIG